MKPKDKKPKKYDIANFYEDILPEVEEKDKIRGRILKFSWYKPKTWRKKKIERVRPKTKYENLKKKDIRKLRKKPDMSFLVKMKFSNGTSKEFVIATRKEIFKYKGKSYYLRYEDSWFNLTQNQHELEFFDDYPTPIKREIYKDGDASFHSVSPDNLKPLIDMAYVKALVSNNLEKAVVVILGISLFMILLMFILTYMVFSMKRLVGGLAL